MTRAKRFWGSFGAVWALSLWLVAANDADKKILTLEDYGQWRRIASTSISSDGKWVSYAYAPNEGDTTLYLKQLGTEVIHEIPRGSGPEFSEDSSWAAYVTTVTEKEAEKLRKSKKPVPRTVEVINLGTGDRFAVENASAFKFSADSSFIAIKKDPIGGDRNDRDLGTDLILYELDKGTAQNIGHVSDYEFNKKGGRLAYTVTAPEGSGNGLYLIDLSSRALRPLDTSSGLYSRLTWDKGGRSLAVLRGTKPEKMTQRTNVLLAFPGVSGGSDRTTVFDPKSAESFPEDMVISEHGELHWSLDGERLFFGIKEQREKPEKGEEPKANIDIWHWKDERVQSVQMRQAQRDRQSTFESVYLLATGRFIQLADEEMPTVTFDQERKIGIGRLDAPYRGEISWGGSRADTYVVDPATGTRKLIVKGIGRPLGLSADGQWYLYQKDGEIFSYELAGGETRNISDAADVDFVNVDDDHPYEKPIWGVAGYSKDGRWVVVNHRYDLWRLALDGSRADNLTQGVGDEREIRFRYVDLSPPEEGSRRRGFFRRGGGRPVEVDFSEPLLLSTYGEWTKRSGYFELGIRGELRELVYEDYSYGRPTKATRADVLLYTRERFEEFPDYWVSNGEFASPQQVTDANPQQSEYRWGRRVLVDYENSRGVKLQATLTLPAGYEAGKRYPMLVYFYEKMSQRHHQYSMPRYDDRPHMSTYASDGYLVLMPDVVYETGRPGDSAVDCVSSAVERVIELGYADRERIGLQGHSWGGYESSFIVTQTDLFAAVVTGAPVTNLVSFYNELYKSTGTVQHGIMEFGQVRMGTIPWKDMELYHSQSPIHQAENISTPFLILHGTEDGAVDWHQGLEYYNTARRLGKKVILLSYPGEGHHLSKRENQKDFLTRMKQFFDHYLKDAPAPGWIADGVDHLDKEWASPTQQ